MRRSPVALGAAIAALLVATAACPRRAAADGNDDPAHRARVERIRLDPLLASDPATLDALALEADGWPGQVRVDAHMLVAEAWLGRLHRPGDGLVLLRKVVDDPEADPVTSRFAEREIVDALVAEGRLDDAVAEAHERANRLDPRFVARTERLVRRRSIWRGALTELAGFAVLAAIGLGRAWGRGALGKATAAVRTGAPVAIVFAVYVACAGGWLASAYESGNAAPFLLLGTAALPLVLLARAWGAVGSPGAPARVLRACVCATSVLAAAFVLLYAVDPDYLEGFGL